MSAPKKFKPRAPGLFDKRIPIKVRSTYKPPTKPGKVAVRGYYRAKGKK